MLSCLRTGDEESAHICLERLTTRFGADNERLMGLRGLFQEAVAKDDAALKQVLDEYDTILKKDPSNMVRIYRHIMTMLQLIRSAGIETSDCAPQDFK